MTRRVWAVDVTATMVSLARIDEGDEKPRIGMIEAEKTTRAHSARTTWHRATTTADKVLAKITESGTPTLVVMAKQRWRDMKPDPTAQRRMQIYALIEDRLHDLNVPVAEFPYPTAFSWLNSYTPTNVKGEAVMKQISDAVTTQWGITALTYRANNGEEHHYSMRIATVLLAAIGAMALGIETKVPVTVRRLEVLGGVKNQAVQWPGNLSLPRTITGWQRRNADPSVCWKDADADGDADEGAA